MDMVKLVKKTEPIGHKLNRVIVDADRENDSQLVEK